jgi:glutaredoxin
VKPLCAVSSRSTVPRVFINGDYIGGPEDLESCLHAEKAA